MPKAGIAGISSKKPQAVNSKKRLTASASSEQSGEQQQSSKKPRLVAARKEAELSNQGVGVTAVANANALIADAIEEIGSLYLIKKGLNLGGRFGKAAAGIRACKKPVSLFTNQNQIARNVDDVGPTIAAHITEFLRTGSIAKLEQLRAAEAD